jgi:hypothetical protein
MRGNNAAAGKLPRIAITPRRVIIMGFSSGLRVGLRHRLSAGFDVYPKKNFHISEEAIALRGSTARMVKRVPVRFAGAVAL